MSDHKSDAVALDKSAWGDGPWSSEPDRLEFEHAGLPCLLARGSDFSGHWCGYVAVPPTHPLHGKSYEEPDVTVHGGLTYAASCKGHICHVPKPGESDNVWWFGFDCAHAGDLSPARHARYLGHGYPFPDKPYNHEEALRLHAQSWSAADVYRTLTYVRGETERLADQLAALAEVPKQSGKRRMRKD